MVWGEGTRRYGCDVEVAVSALRAELKQWIETARAGADVVITERGVPVARLTAVDSADLVARLERDGLLTAPTVERPAARAEEPATGPAAAVTGLIRRLRH
jgi:prevent-host-death family protein